jgi:hypothetical protein
MYSFNADQDRRLETAGWGLLLLVIGAIALVPGLPEGAWLIGAGVVLLGITLARFVMHVGPSGFTALVGTGAVALGVESATGVDLPWLAVLLVACGLVLVLRAVRGTDRMETGACTS